MIDGGMIDSRMIDGRMIERRRARPILVFVALAVVAVVAASCSSDTDGAGASAGSGTVATSSTPMPGSVPDTADLPPSSTDTTEADEADEEASAPDTSGPEATAATSPTTTAPPPCEQAAVGVTEFTLTAGGADHPVRVFVPSSFSGEVLATVIDWHGLGGNGPQQAAITRYEEVAETEGFIVVHPTGVPAVGDDRNSWQLVSLPGDGARDDLAFADQLIDDLIAGWCADPNRIYSTGMSNGGFFTARLVCEMADRLAAASSVAGLYHLDDCTPSRPVPYLAYHGTADSVVPFDGSGESVLLGDGSNPALRVFFEQVMPDEFAEFAADAGCDPAPAVGAIGEVIRYDYTGCADDTPMSFFEIPGGGHTWPNWPVADAVAPVFGYTTTDVDATVDSWAFFRQHTLA